MAIPCPQCQTCDIATALCGPVADSTACNDGNACTTGETCQRGICGGGSPVTCGSGQHCVGGICVCDGASCAGCCAGTTCVLVASQTDTQCGTGTAGRACGACAANQDCVGGSCTCTTGSCPTGCCAGTTCQAGDTKAACGDGGVTCVTCSADATVSCSNNGSAGTCLRACVSQPECGGGGCFCQDLEGGGTACANVDAGHFTCIPVADCATGGCPSGRVCLTLGSSIGLCGSDTAIRACVDACAAT
jgi:hypothetical protein